MAVKIVRQAKKIVLIGAPTSAGAHNAGTERAPGALRAAGLVARLQAAGFEVADAGDIPVHAFQPDEESPRARNLGAVVSALNALRPLVEQAVKSGALPLVVGGDCTIALATIAGVRRYFPHVSLVYCDRDADLNTPATTPSGCLHGMGVAHIIGHGAPELVRFFTDPPLVRQPDLAFFGLERLDPPEEQFLMTSPIRRYSVGDIRRQGAAAAASAAIQRIHSTTKQLVVHLDVDALTAEEFSACDFPAPGGLTADEMRQALEVFARQPNLAAVEVTAYVPEKDPDGSAARLLVELLGAALAARLEPAAPPAEEAKSAAAAAEAPPAAVAPPAATAEEPVAAPPAEQPAVAEEQKSSAAEASPAAAESTAEPTSAESSS